MNSFLLARTTLTVVIAASLISPVALADPCGMVPPIYAGNQSPITRIGLQKTYVFYKDGVETFVIRPGFSGNVDNFGMLIPFPAPPELRKVPDNVFEQLVNAIDPPEVVVDLRVRRMMARGAVPAPAGAMAEGKALEFKRQVRVIKEEAVGMYEIAVLEAGSANALKRWMDENGYKYPDGMDKVTEDYVESGWCFVAVKTRVGQKAAVDPAPGKRTVDARLPDGSVFDGNVQAMGFRFKTDELVVPMRLSAFNEGDLRNVVYLLADGPRRIRSIPEEYVMRQISGQQLFDNVTQPLPLRIIGGTEKDIPEYQRAGLAARRDPGPRNGVAKELFAADLLAVASGNLSLEHEEQEKELLRIGEHFGLRGGEIDTENLDALDEARTRTVDEGLALLKNMTLTVVDGDFPREVIANQNLTFASYQMPDARNNPLNYEAPRFGPGSKKEGTLKLGSIRWDEPAGQPSQTEIATRGTPVMSLGAMLLLGLMALVLPSRKWMALATLIAVGLLSGSALASNAFSQDTPEELIEKLEDSKTAHDAIKAIREHANASEQQRNDMVKRLLEVVKSDAKLPKKGWAIAALGEIGGQDVDEYLLNVHADTGQTQLVRTWAAAARVSMTRTVNGLIEKANLIPQFPALGRPIGMRIVEQMNSGEDQGDPEKIIGVTQQVPQLQQALAPAIMAFGAGKLTEVMLHAGDNNTRRTAAGYLGALASQGETGSVVKSLVEELQFNPQANEVPWDGGALFIPGINWDRDDARALVGNLIRWYLWCDIQNKPDLRQQINNNIRSLGLANAAGYQSPGFQPDVDAVNWLKAWGEAVGKEEVQKILEELDVEDNRKYSSVLGDL